jgi:hypothetical protein
LCSGRKSSPNPMTRAAYPSVAISATSGGQRARRIDALGGPWGRLKRHTAEGSIAVHGKTERDGPASVVLLALKFAEPPAGEASQVVGFTLDLDRCRQRRG